MYFSTRFRLFACAFGLLLIGVAHGNVTLNFGFGNLRDASGSLAPAGSLWALIIAPQGETLPGGLDQDTHLTEDDLASARADFGGATIAPGVNIGNATVMATGQLGEPGILDLFILWTNQDYATIQAGGLIGLYWFPGINAESTLLPESGFAIGGLHETSADPGSGGNAGMIVPANGGQTLSIAYYDENITGGASRLPVERFTGIEVPASDVTNPPEMTKWYVDAIKLDGDWLYFDWFKAFKPVTDQWIYHARHGWLFSSSADTSSLFLWDSALGRWLWTSETVYPWIYAFGPDEGWLFFFENGSPGARFFGRGDTGEIIPEEAFIAN